MNDHKLKGTKRYLFIILCTKVVETLGKYVVTKELITESAWTTIELHKAVNIRMIKLTYRYFDCGGYYVVIIDKS